MKWHFSNNEKKFLLRWRFDFASSPTKYGMWNSAGPSQHGAHMAWSTNKEGLIKASIEAKNIRTKEVKTVVACDGHDFVNLKWQARASHGFAFNGRTHTELVGMILQTRDLDVLYLMDGNHATRQRTQQDKEFHYAGFGR